MTVRFRKELTDNKKHVAKQDVCDRKDLQNANIRFLFE